MEELKLKLNTGAKIVPIFDADGEKIGEFRFNPSDLSIAKRADAAIKEYNEAIKKHEFPKDDAESDVWRTYIFELENDVNNLFDSILGYEAHNAVFARCSALAITEDGSFFFEQVIDGIADLIEQATKHRIAKRNKIAKATAKYSKK